MRYKQVEEVLSKIFLVSSDKIKAFRARLRHLRNIGIPYDLQKPGSGAQISYTSDNVVELLIALELETLGIAPRRTVSLSHEAILPGLFGLPVDNMYMVIVPDGGFMPRKVVSIEVKRLEAFELNQMIMDQRRLLIVNLSASLEMLDDLLAKTIKSVP